MSEKIEQLEARLTGVTGQQQKIDIMNELAWELRKIDARRAFTLSEEAYTLAHQGRFETTPYQKGLAYSLSHLGYLNYYKANYTLALSQSLAAVSLFEKLRHFKRLPVSLSIIGIAQLRLGNYSEALPYQIKALKIAEEIGDRSGKARALNGIAIVYVWSSDHEQALSYFEQSLQIYRQIGDRFGEARTLTNLCMSYRDLGQFEKSLEYGFNCLQISPGTDNEVWALNNIGNTYSALGKSAEALIYFHKALELLENMEDKFVQVTTLLHTGKAYYRQKEPELAQTYLSEALSLAEASDQKGFQFECHQALAETYKDQGDFERALSHYEQFQAIKETVFNEEADNKLKNLEVLHRTETAKKETEIYQLKNVALKREIAERKRAEETLRVYTAELEAKNAELERFTYTVSHDLKSPLVTIRGFLGVLEQDALAGDAAQMKEDIRHIRDATGKMKQLLDNLLELSRIGRIINPPEEVSLAELAHEAVGLVAGQITGRGVQVDISPDLPLIFGDRTRLLEVLQNLIDNAVKYMGDQSEPHIKIGARQEGEEIVCYVRDNGMGVDPRYQEKVFGLFERLDQKIEGTGVGLALVQRIVELHNGRVWVKSAGVGQGCIFCFTLPSRPPG